MLSVERAGGIEVSWELIDVVGDKTPIVIHSRYSTFSMSRCWLGCVRVRI